MTAAALNIAENPVLQDAFKRDACSPALDTATRLHLIPGYCKQLAVGSIGADPSIKAFNDNTKTNDNGSADTRLSDGERAAWAAFYRWQIPIAPLNGPALYEDAFARIGLRIRVGDRQITRRRREENRVRAFG